MASVLDVAKYILEQAGEPVTTMKLQKLVYYSQAWQLVWEEVPLFHNKIQAWANGPVCPDLFDQHRGRFTVEAESFPGDSSHLNDGQRETIDVVLGAYGHLSGQDLSDLSHSERPWREARMGVDEGEASRNVISLDTMQDYYTAVLNAENGR